MWVFDVGTAGILGCGNPSAIASAPALDHAQSVLQSRIPRDTRSTQNIEAVKDVEMPPCGMMQPGELSTDRFVVRASLVQTARQ